MKPFIMILAALIFSLLAWLGFAAYATSTIKDVTSISRPAAVQKQPLRAGELTVMIWNVGYAGLGEESDFKMDGGTMLQPPGRKVVKKNLAGILKTLNSHIADFYLMQELAGPGFLTHGINVRDSIATTLKDYSMFFSSDISTRFIPVPFGLHHGLATFSRISDTVPESISLPEEPGLIMGFIPRKYHAQITDVDVEGSQWSVINIHLAAFDEGANTRNAQLDAVFELAQRLYAEGRHVVIGGDWNMRLTETDFASTSTEDALFWIHDFPKNKLPEGWRLVFDPHVPTVRTNERPFITDENYRTIIDGLLISPDIDVVSADGVDLGFSYTDHQPAVFRLTAAQSEVLTISDDVN